MMIFSLVAWTKIDVRQIAALQFPNVLREATSRNFLNQALTARAPLRLPTQYGSRLRSDRLGKPSSDFQTRTLSKSDRSIQTFDSYPF